MPTDSLLSNLGNRVTANLSNPGNLALSWGNPSVFYGYRVTGYRRSPFSAGLMYRSLRRRPARNPVCELVSQSNTTAPSVQHDAFRFGA